MIWREESAHGLWLLHSDTWETVKIMMEQYRHASLMSQCLPMSRCVAPYVDLILLIELRTLIHRSLLITDLFINLLFIYL